MKKRIKDFTTTAIAIYAAILATITLVIQMVEYDESKPKISLEILNEISEQIPTINDKLYKLNGQLTILNEGYNPITIVNIKAKLVDSSMVYLLGEVSLSLETPIEIDALGFHKLNYQLSILPKYLNEIISKINIEDSSLISKKQGYAIIKDDDLSWTEIVMNPILQRNIDSIGFSLPLQGYIKFVFDTSIQQEIIIYKPIYIYSYSAFSRIYH